MTNFPDRYGFDVLDPRAAQNRKPKVEQVPAALGMVLEDPSSGFVGEVVAWENGLVVLEDRKAKRRSFPFGPGFWLEGKPIVLTIPPRTGSTEKRYTPSGARMVRSKARVALPSRIYVEGRHDAELVEKIWGDDLRHVGVVVEYLGGIDDLVAIVRDFKPAKSHRLGVLVDHLVSGSKEQRIAAEVAKLGYSEFVEIRGHQYIDIWQAIRPQTIGLAKWPTIERGTDFKKGTLTALNLPHKDQTDIANFWRALLAKVKSWRDLDGDLVRQMELLIDFVTQDHLDQFD